MPMENVKMSIRSLFYCLLFQMKIALGISKEMLMSLLVALMNMVLFLSNFLVYFLL